MASSPAEYLTLTNTSASANFSQYTAGGAVSGTNVTTRYALAAELAHLDEREAQRVPQRAESFRLAGRALRAGGLHERPQSR